MISFRALPILLVATSTFIVAGCSTFNATSRKSEAFQPFFNRFFTEPEFQKSRVSFPVAVYTSSPDGDNFSRMPVGEWRQIYTIPSDTLIQGVRYKREIKKNGNTMQQRVYIPNSGFQHTCTFAQQHGKWYLVRMEESSY